MVPDSVRTGLVVAHVNSAVYSTATFCGADAHKTLRRAISDYRVATDVATRGLGAPTYRASPPIAGDVPKPTIWPIGQTAVFQSKETS